MMKEKTTAFERCRQTLSPAENEALDIFFADYELHNFLGGNEKARMRIDFENAILTYLSLGVPLTEALRRLSIDNLGGFYARPSLRWYPLDNAAKIYPFSMTHGRMAVFRLSVYLTQAVIPEILQMALTFTIKRFPSFATTVKKGFFWHYLDTSKRRYSVETETSIPCRPLKVERSGSQTFRVISYQNRISVEFFHILTDGHGGIVFLKTLLAEYLRLLGIESGKDQSTFDVNETPSPHELTNEFALVPKTDKASGFVDKPAVQMSGRLTWQKPCRVLHFKINADSMKRAAKRYSATITAYLLALIFVAAKNATDETKGMLNVQVPVNMRKFYPSETLRNFSMYCGIKLPLKQITDVQSIIEDIAAQLTQKASQSVMSEMVTATERLVAAMRFIPLMIKTPAVKLVNGFLSDRIFSTTLSNLGVIHLLPELMTHVLSMDAAMGPAITNRASCALVTLGNTATLSITKITVDPTFEETLYGLLVADAVSLTVEGSALYED
ncbi:MAG: hypothetical protein ABIK64_02425 [Bacillota bacterium]